MAYRLYGGDLSVAVAFPADGADRAYVRENIDFPGKECVLVFPNGVVGVMVDKLNFSAPFPQGSTLGYHAMMVLPCGDWSIYQGQFLTSFICLPSYHRSKDFGNRPHQTPSIMKEITEVV